MVLDVDLGPTSAEKYVNIIEPPHNSKSRSMLPSPLTFSLFAPIQKSTHNDSSVYNAK
ncbi:hypothetical protein [Candidatus Nitrosocosmicus sp. R]